jgi:glycosyltransferase involved in cell wall biosynthesis
MERSIVAIIPLYNGRKFIEESIDSVLAQTRPPDEFIVVDDGSTDGGAEVVRKIAADKGITLLHKPNGGQSSARNFGVAKSKSSLIALLDQDDIWYPHHLERLVKPFHKDRDRQLGWSYSNLDEIDEEGNFVKCKFLDQMPVSHPKRSLFACLSDDMFVLPSASLISRDAFIKVGGFDERLSGYEDDDLFLRLFRAGYDNVYINEALSKWRIYSSSTSYSPRMLKSRIVYAEKLFAEFPDNPVLNRFCSRDLLAPRFSRNMLGDYARGVRMRNRPLMLAALGGLKSIRPRFSIRRQALFLVFTSLGQWHVFGRLALVVAKIVHLR